MTTISIRSLSATLRQALRLSAALCLFVVSAAVLTAQTTATLQGTIADSKGGLLANATVAVRSATTGKIRTVTSDATGHYTVTGLLPGVYTVTADAPGFAEAINNAVTVGDKGAEVALTLQVSSATADITVDADATHSIAAALAPMDALLTETSARTEITSAMITNFSSPVADYGESVEMAPGTFTTNGNGVGLGQSKTSFRGFPDGLYDIKFDGIPFTDTNSVSHHSWSFFPSQFLGGIDFDRSPGTASTIGYAPFGGSINLLSKPFSPEQNIRAGFNYGSYNTELADVEYDSGSFGPGKRLSLNMDVHHMGSDGYQTWNHQTRNAGDMHVQYKLGDKTTITGFSGVIWLDANTPNFNASRCQMYGTGTGYTCPTNNFTGSGINFLLTDNSDPLNYRDNQYNYYHVPTDFEYVGVHTELGHGFSIDFKPYTYNYDNSEKYTNAVVITDNAALVGTTYAPLGVTLTNALLCNYVGTASTTATAPGYGCGVDKYNSYRTYGETSQLTQVSKFGILRTGLWYSWSDTNRHQYPADPLNNWKDAVFPNFSEHFLSDAYNPFIEYEWHATSQLSLTAGVKWAYYSINTTQYADNGGKIGCLATSCVNANPATFINNGGNYFATLPSVAANYRFANNWSGYAQYATGSITPPSSTFDFAQSPTGTPVATEPYQQRTQTYQIGTVLKLKRATLDISAYHIHFGSGYSSFTPNSGPTAGEPIYYPTPPARTEGVEAESNISLTHGLSIYLNGAFIDAKYIGNAEVFCTSSAAGCTSTTAALTIPTPSGLWVAGTPSDVLTEALMYQHKGWDAGFFAKTVGTQRLDNGAYHNEATISPFTLANLFLNYTIRGGSHFDNTKLRLSFNNLLDSHNITTYTLSTKDTAGSITANGTTYADPFNSKYTTTPIAGGDSVTILPGRSIMFSVIFGFSPHGR